MISISYRHNTFSRFYWIFRSRKQMRMFNMPVSESLEVVVGSLEVVLWLSEMSSKITSSQLNHSSPVHKSLTLHFSGLFNDNHRFYEWNRGLWTTDGDLYTWLWIDVIHSPAKLMQISIFYSVFRWYLKFDFFGFGIVIPATNLNIGFDKRLNFFIQAAAFNFVKF